MQSDKLEAPRGALLLVEDQPLILDLLTHVCESAGYRCLRASNGAEALDVFRSHHFEIAAIVTDVKMPVVDGYAVARGARKIEPQVKIVLSSGNLSGTGQRHISDLGLCAVLPKPYTASQVVSCIHSILNDRADRQIHEPHLEL